MPIKSVFLTKITKQGNSLCVTIPREVLTAYHWQRGDILIFGFAGNEQLYLKRISPQEWEALKPQNFINY